MVNIFSHHRAQKKDFNILEPIKIDEAKWQAGSYQQVCVSDDYSVNSILITQSAPLVYSAMNAFLAEEIMLAVFTHLPVNLR